MVESTIPESEVQVVKTAILGFINDMKKDKRFVEQQIREQSENLRSNLLGSGTSQFSYQDVDNLSKSYKDEFINFYRNTVHLKIVASASSKIKSAIEKGFIDADIVQQEWLDGFTQLQQQINTYQNVMDKAEQLENQLKGTLANQEDIDEVRRAFSQGEQLLAEKDQEIMNLNEGLARMENQMNSLGQNMLENSMTIEELQEAINDRDIEIQNLKQELVSRTGNTAEIELLQQQLSDSRERENQLQQQASTASTDLVSQLQNNLEETRGQFLEVRKEIVQKNEELHVLKLEQDEYSIKRKQIEDNLEEVNKERNSLRSQNDQLASELQDLKSQNSTTSGDLRNKISELEVLKSQLDDKEKSLTSAKDELAGYEGKVAMSIEEQDRINKELDRLKGQLDIYQSTVNYLKGILGSDVKFRVLLILATMDQSIRLDDLSNAVGVPETTVHRAIIEMSENGFLTTSKDGRNVFALLEKSLRPPALLTSD